jgi:hypothetical protein
VVLGTRRRLNPGLLLEFYVKTFKNPNFKTARSRKKQKWVEKLMLASRKASLSLPDDLKIFFFVIFLQKLCNILPDFSQIIGEIRN